MKMKPWGYVILPLIGIAVVVAAIMVTQDFVGVMGVVLLIAVILNFIGNRLTKRDRKPREPQKHEASGSKKDTLLELAFIIGILAFIGITCYFRIFMETMLTLMTIASLSELLENIMSYREARRGKD